jgi:hypothetical protein
MTTRRINAVPTPTHSPKPVYVVCRRQGATLVAAEHVNGRTVEHFNAASATRAADRMGGAKANLGVFVEWRDEQGNPCSGPYLRADPKGEGRT